MGLMNDILLYTDAQGLVCPKPADPRDLYGSGNGVIYTAEFMVIMAKYSLLEPEDIHDYEVLMKACYAVPGVINRVPHNINRDQDGPDDYYGLLNACMQLHITSIPRDMLKAAIKYKGAFNNAEPGKWTAQSFLIRQPQLLTCMVASAFPSLKNPLHWLMRLLFLPFFIVSAIIISLNSAFSDHKEVDTRRLGWHVMQNLKPVSLLCKLASLIWYKRLYKDYGSKGMKAVAALYYSENHPFNTYWVD